MSPRDAPPLPHEEHVAVDGARLFVRHTGRGLPLLVVHGGPDFDHAYLLPELDQLATAFRVICYDQRGRGRSSGGVSAEDVTIESEIDDLDAVRRHLGVETIAILGHSWGCLLALEYTARHSERVSHLVLLNPAPASHADLLHFRAARASDDPADEARMQAIAATQAYASGDIATEAEYYRIHFRHAFGRVDALDDVVSRLRTHFTPEDIVKARAIEERLYAQTWRRPDYDVLPALGDIHVPTLVVHGDRDLIPSACARRIADAIPGARFVLLEDCGHFSCLERPDDVRRAIEALLAGSGNGELT
jgi:proline iminopeptidase